MKLKLIKEINGEEVEHEYSTGRMRGRQLKRMLEVQDVMQKAADKNEFTQEHYDLMCEFIVEIFNNQFSVDDLLDGIDLCDVYPTFTNLINDIGNKTMSKMENLIKN